MDKVTLKYLVIIFFIFNLSSCKETLEKTIIPIETESNEASILPNWLIGKWENNEDNELYLEKWNGSTDTLYCEGYIVKNEEVNSPKEFVKIFQRGTQLVYQVQNENHPVSFTIEKLDEKSFICKNPSPTHFPSTIKYTLIQNDELIIEIAGLVDNELDSYAFNMKKKK